MILCVEYFLTLIHRDISGNSQGLSPDAAEIPHVQSDVFAASAFAH
jgi:hypothetical protein